ncbi:MAG: threonine--tRNA ligase [Oscillospiraceae bacterium]
MKITLKGDIVKEYASGTSCADIARELGAGLYKAACCAKVNGKVCDLRYKINEDAKLEILTFDDEDGARTFRHTASHILALAVRRLFPAAKIAIGPAIEDGFYYDFDVETPFSAQDLEKLEAEMKAIVKADLPLIYRVVSADEANEIMANEPYKLELIAEHAAKGEDISLYDLAEFTDLCAGPHLMSTGSVKAFKLTSATGAYWRGDSHNAMLCRIYGTAFPKQSVMEEFLLRQEEAKKRDHNKIGRELEYFTTCDLIGQGLPIMLPNGARVIQLLQRFVEDEEQRRGWQLTKTPYMAKSDLYKVSGHWDHYKDGMFVLGDEATDDEIFALRPMTCPFQYQAYLNRQRSYRDLPIRYDETSTLFRNEASGEMHGLIRVRQFTISEGHLMCTPSQLESEFRSCLELAIFMLKTLGLYEDVSYRFSLWDENDKDKYIGTVEQWDETQGMMRKILDHLEIPYKEGIGEAAFYGPKLDIQIRNVYGKEDTLITIQIDRMLAEKFGMEYTDADGKKKTPCIIHRTSIGCYERTLALLLEKYAGALPVWLMPTQVMLVPISDAHHDYAAKVLEELQLAGIRAEADYRSEKMGYKIREAQLSKIPYMLVMGNEEAESGTVSVRARKEANGGKKTVAEFIAAIKAEIDSKEI